MVCITISLIGCGKPITIEQYNEAKKYCEANNMKPVKRVIVTRYGGESKEVYGVTCVDAEGNTFPSKGIK